MEQIVTLQIWIHKKMIEANKIMSDVENCLWQGNSKHDMPASTTFGVLQKRELGNYQDCF